MIARTVQLSRGLHMPVFGLGTWQIKDCALLHSLIDTALAQGMRLIDTAAVYGNERMIGDALKVLLPKHDLTRKDVFITSKLQPSDQGKADQAVQTSLHNLQMDYLDLYLVHWPGTAHTDSHDPINAHNRTRTWQQLEAAVDSGKLRAIGVSNYLVRHIDELLAIARIAPVLNQFEWHVYYADHDLLKHCTANGIHCQAYSTLGSPNAAGAVLNDACVLSVSADTGHSPAQVLLAWALQHGLSVLPRTTKPHRVIDNYKSLQVNLSKEHMQRLDALDKRVKYCWDPSKVV